MVQDCGGILSVVLAGHPKLKNDLRRSSLEEIGSRTTVFNLDGIAASNREFIEWLLRECSKAGSEPGIDQRRAWPFIIASRYT
jgi:type II secretory pathway predicted ATPase ExeA